MHVLLILPLTFFFHFLTPVILFKSNHNAEFLSPCLFLSIQQHAINLNQYVQDKGL